MPVPIVITVDGPASSGKSTLGELLARTLGFVYFDTGVMYRAVTLAACQHGLDLGDTVALEHLAHTLRIDVLSSTEQDGRQYTVLVDGQDVTWDLRSAIVDGNVSLVSSYPGVRAELIRQQRAIGQRGRVVMVGRDIGTIVMPDAPLKIYLTASLEERARRRARDQQLQGRSVSIEQVRAELARRDKLDTHVIQPAADALHLNTDALSPADAVAWVLAHWQHRLQELSPVLYQR